jgi:glycosyltransferase involved in cell wall biosynthesis
VLSGWFRLDWLAAFVAVAARHDPTLVFEVTTRDDPVAVRAAIDPTGGLGARLRVAPAASGEVPEVLQGQLASVMFYAGGEVSELGRSPTRMAEILGCGLPVVANGGVGDVARIIRDHRVGVVVRGSAEPEMQAAFDALLVLLADPGLATRCRKAAEELFSLDAGAAAFAALYEQVIGAAADARR